MSKAPTTVYEQNNGLLNVYKVPESLVDRVVNAEKYNKAHEKISIGNLHRSKSGTGNQNEFEGDWVLILKGTKVASRKANKIFRDKVSKTSAFYHRRDMLCSRPKRKKRPVDYFQSQYHKGHKEKHGSSPFHEVSSAGRAIWAQMSEGQRLQYVEMAKIDGVRFEEEQAKWLENNKIFPLPPKSPYSLFISEQKGVDGKLNWKALDQKQKQGYRAMSERDKIRFDKEKEDYALWQQAVHAKLLVETGIKNK
jgi:hypothetical protein